MSSERFMQQHYGASVWYMKRDSDACLTCAGIGNQHLPEEVVSCAADSNDSVASLILQLLTDVLPSYSWSPSYPRCSG